MTDKPIIPVMFSEFKFILGLQLTFFLLLINLPIIISINCEVYKMSVKESNGKSVHSFPRTQNKIFKYLVLFNQPKDIQFIMI